MISPLYLMENAYQKFHKRCLYRLGARGRKQTGDTCDELRLPNCIVINDLEDKTPRSNFQSTWLTRLRGQSADRAPCRGESSARAGAVAELTALSEPQARGFLERTLAFELEVLPLQILIEGNQRVMLAAVCGDEDPELRKNVTFAGGFPVRFIRVEREVLREALARSYLGDEEGLEKSALDLANYGEKIARKAQPSAVAPVVDANEITRFASKIIEYAVAHRASDIHLSARRNGAFVQLRIKGELRTHDSPLSTLDAYRQLVSRIKILAGIDITERTLPQDGRFAVTLQDRTIDIRVSTMPTVHGENIVMRLFGAENASGLAGLGLEDRLLAAICQVIERGAGAIIVSGPTGSGKTSTLYAIAAELLRKSRVIATIEDPVEIEVEGMVQTSIDEGRGFGFPQALRAVLRQDPDVILIGEMRDAVSARAALDAALSGHLVLSTVHGGSVADVLNRFGYLGVDRALAAQALRIVIAQRLIDRLCPACRVFDLRSANLAQCDVFKPVGCRQCEQSGYAGKILSTEALIFDDSFRQFYATSSMVTTTHVSQYGTAFFPRIDRLKHHLVSGDIDYRCYGEFI